MKDESDGLFQLAMRLLRYGGTVFGSVIASIEIALWVNVPDRDIERAILKIMIVGSLVVIFSGLAIFAFIGMATGVEEDEADEKRN